MKKRVVLLLLGVWVCMLSMGRAEALPLKQGTKNDEVKLLQMRLLEYGFWNGTPSGVFDEETEEAVVALQRYLHKEEAVDGIVDETLYRMLMNGNFPVYLKDIRYGDCDPEVRRLQTRLASLGYLDGEILDVFDDRTQNAIDYFQKLNELGPSAYADSETQLRLYSRNAVSSDKPVYQYYIKINIASQRLYVFTSQDGDDLTLVKDMICSTGLNDTPTPIGIFQSGGPVARWCYFPDYDCWAQYAFRVEGTILIHSVLYAKADENTLKPSSVKNLGKKASRGCVRLALEDAKWIYENCKAGTTVEVVEN